MKKSKGTQAKIIEEIRDEEKLRKTINKTFRFERVLVERFQAKCLVRNVSMTAVLEKLMIRFLRDD